MGLLRQTCKREPCHVIFLPKRLRHPANIANDDKCAAGEIAIVLIPRLFPLTPTGQITHRPPFTHGRQDYSSKTPQCPPSEATPELSANLFMEAFGVPPQPAFRFGCAELWHLSSWVAILSFVPHNRQKDGAETMESRSQKCSPTINLNRVPPKYRSRKEDAIRRLFSVKASPEAKAEIAARFKGLRKRTSLSQARLGEIIGICRQAVNEIENSHVWPHYTTLDKFSDFEEKHNQPQIDLPVHWS
jgi:DNA-binding XRE family transcriptional regulator